MEKRLRSSLQTSADNFLQSAVNLSLKSSKSTLKTLIHNISPSSDLSTSLPLSLHSSISQSIASFKNPEAQSKSTTPPPPSTKRLRRSGRNVGVGSETAEETDETKRRCVLLQNLQVYAYVVYVCVTHPKKVFSLEDLLPAVRELHDNLILFESDSLLLAEISNLCEVWWKEDLIGKEMLISQFLPFLVARSLTLRKKVDVHRVYALREAFLLFDFEDNSIEDLRLLLMRCVIMPLYLKTEDGRRFIAFMFGLSIQLLKEALAMIKSQISFGRKSMLEAYGDIVFRGWKSVEGDLKREIEDGLLQGLIEGAILAHSASFAASIRRVLGGFINQRTTDGVEKLLFRLAEPVIFRSLQVANSNVRQNALHLLLDMFPLEDPDATKEDKDTMLDKQFFLLEKLLTDDCPDIRVVAVEGCCRILRLFWEIIPSPTITKIMTKIFDDMLHDISNEVRHSTLNGIIYLTGNPHCHEILKVLLPRLRHMILDSVLSIRLAVTDILLVINGIQGFQFNKVVSLDVLLTTLANDQTQVAQKITQLLMPSYFPPKVKLAEACTRFMTLMKRSPMAGARFCEFLASEGAPRKSLLELLKVLINIASTPSNLDSNQIEAILVAATHLCNDLIKEANYKETLRELLSGEKLKHLLTVVPTRRAQSSLCSIVSVVSPDGVTGLLEKCLDLVKDCCGLVKDSEKQANVRSAHKLILSCNWLDEMVEALAGVLQSHAVTCHNIFNIEIPRQFGPPAERKKSRPAKMSTRSKNGSSNKKPAFKDDYEIAAGISWQIKELLASDASRKALLESKFVEMAFLSLKVVSEISITHCVCCDFMDTSGLVAYGALSLHMTLQNVCINGIAGHSNEENDNPASNGSSTEVNDYLSLASY